MSKNVNKLLSEILTRQKIHNSSDIPDINRFLDMVPGKGPRIVNQRFVSNFRKGGKILSDYSETNRLPLIPDVRHSRTRNRENDREMENCCGFSISKTLLRFIRRGN